MILVHVEAERNLRSVVEDNREKGVSGEETQMHV